MTTEVCTAVEGASGAETATTSCNQSQQADSMVESVAKVISGVAANGHARNLLQAAGWAATIAANRITVDGAVEAQFIPAQVGRYGRVDARWIVSSTVGTDPVWIVGTQQG